MKVFISYIEAFKLQVAREVEDPFFGPFPHTLMT